MWNNEKQLLLEIRTKSLKKAEERVEELSQKNLALNTQNIQLKENNVAQRKLISKIIKLAQSNTYNNNEIRLNKIKELVTDFQSNN